MDGQCLLPNTVLPSKFDGLNFDGLAESVKTIKISRYTVFLNFILT